MQARIEHSVSNSFAMDKALFGMLGFVVTLMSIYLPTRNRIYYFIYMRVCVYALSRWTRCFEINFVITLVFAISHIFPHFWRTDVRFIVWFNPSYCSYSMHEYVVNKWWRCFRRNWLKEMNQNHCQNDEWFNKIRVQAIVDPFLLLL